MRRRYAVRLVLEAKDTIELFRYLLALGLTTDDVQGVVRPDGSILAIAERHRWA